MSEARNTDQIGSLLKKLLKQRSLSMRELNKLTKTDVAATQE